MNEITTTSEEVFRLVSGLTLNQKIDRSLDLIDEAYTEYGDNLVVANSLGKDSLGEKTNNQDPDHIMTHENK